MKQTFSVALASLALNNPAVPAGPYTLVGSVDMIRPGGQMIDFQMSIPITLAAEYADAAELAVFVANHLEGQEFVTGYDAAGLPVSVPMHTAVESGWLTFTLEDEHLTRVNIVLQSQADGMYYQASPAMFGERLNNPYVPPPAPSSDKDYTGLFVASVGLAALSLLRGGGGR